MSIDTGKGRKICTFTVKKAEYHKRKRTWMYQLSQGDEGLYADGKWFAEEHLGIER